MPLVVNVIDDVLNVHRGSVYCIDVIPCESGVLIIATGSNDKSISLSRVLADDVLHSTSTSTSTSMAKRGHSGTVVAQLKGHTGTIRVLQFCRYHTSKSTVLLVSGGSGDCCPRVWLLDRSELDTSVNSTSLGLSVSISLCPPLLLPPHHGAVHRLLTDINNTKHV